jgi:hypothetical protein
MEALDCDVKTVGTTPHGVHFMCRGKRKSGRGNTSGGNTTLSGMMNFAGAVDAYEKANGRPGWVDPVKKIAKIPCRLSIKHAVIKRTMESINWERAIKHMATKSIFTVLIIGDDNKQFFCQEISKFIENSLIDAFTLLGHEPKVFIRGEYHSEYCSGRFYPSTVGEIWGPKIGRLVAKTFWTDDKMTFLRARQHLRGIALGFKDDVNHIPVARAVVGKILQITEPLGNVKIVRQDYSIRVAQRGDANVDTYAMLESIYGLTKSQLDSLELYISQVDTLPHFINHPVMDVICSIDCPVDATKPTIGAQSIYECSYVPFYTFREWVATVGNRYTLLPNYCVPVRVF